MTDTRLLIQGMHCGSCAARIENALAALDGVTSVSVNFATMIGAVRHDSALVSVDALCEAVRGVGFGCVVQRSTRPRLPATHTAMPREILEARDALATDDADDHVTTDRPRDAPANDVTSRCCRSAAAASTESIELHTLAEAVHTGENGTAVKTPLTFTFLVEGMSCASCAARIEAAVAKQFASDGNSAFTFTLAFATCMASATTQSQDEFDAVSGLIQSMGYQVRNVQRRDRRREVAKATSSDDLTVAVRVSDSANSTAPPHNKRDAEAAAAAAARRSQPHNSTHDGDETNNDNNDDAEAARSARDQTKRALARDDEIAQQKRHFLLSAVLSAPLMLVMLLMSFTSVLHNHMAVAKVLDVGQLLLTTPIVFYCGRQFFTRAWQSWQHGAYTMDTLVALGTGCSYAYSVVALLLSLMTSTYVMPYFDTAGMLTAFMLLGRYLEARAKRSTSGALLALMNLIPSEATVVQPDGSTVRMTPDAITVGMHVRIAPGERIPIDGTVIEGISEVDEQMITGESLPKVVKPGKKVVSGTLNVAAVMTVVAEKVGADTMLSQILRITEEAQNAKPAVQRIADAVAMRFVPAVVALAVTTLVVWLLLGALHAYPEAWLMHSSSGTNGGSAGAGMEATQTSWVGFAFNFFIATVVAACPCALGLATPTAIMVGTGVGARNGLLVKSGITLEAVRQTRCVLLDKTGTITRGLLSVVDVHLLALPPPLRASSCEDVAVVDDNGDFGCATKAKAPSGSAVDDADTADDGTAALRWTPHLVRQVVCEVEGQSSHPIAKAVHATLANTLQSSSSTGGDGAGALRHCAVLSAVNRSGRGVEACVRLSHNPSSPSLLLTDAAVAPSSMTHSVLVGNLKMLHERGVVVDREVELVARQQLSKGFSIVLAAIDGTVCLLASLADEPKPEAAGVIAALKHRGLRVRMVTGDHTLVAARIAVAVGLDPQLDVVAEALPGDKAAIVRQCQEDIGPVLFVGDGINDSPALAAADVGVALGAGTEIAMEAADAVLVRSSLVDLMNLFKLSNTTVRHIYGNFVWAFAYNLIMLPLACGLLYPVLHVQVPPVLAGIAMVLSSLSVLLSSLSVKLFRPHSEADFM